MKAKREDMFKNLLKQAGADEAAEGFTDAVMNMIEADAVQEIALKSLLKQHPAEGVSFDFTAAVMRQIGTARKPLVVQPVISKKAWFGIAGFFAAILLLLIGLSGSKTTDSRPVDNIGTVITRYVAAMPTVYVIAAAIIAILFLADYFFTSRTKKTIAG
ncbi:hypothetical protein [Mucilaginibacter sp. dw_454]|uniref:hypothetical protein n=1 Tax=Mucilaginibacter sp. dw_454 TaxID=2720079 RepID=UPI001BD4458F|nr:hypothetical protein [Mucilaginibacter sp. dw_454]